MGYILNISQIGFKIFLDASQMNEFDNNVMYAYNVFS